MHLESRDLKSTDLLPRYHRLSQSSLLALKHLPPIQQVSRLTLPLLLPAVPLTSSMEQQSALVSQEFWL